MRLVVSQEIVGSNPSCPAKEFIMRDYTICTYCIHNIEKAYCKKGHRILKKTKDGIRIGPKDGKCEDKEEETLYKIN